MSLLFIFLWMPPTGLSSRGIFLYFLVVSLGFFTCYAVWTIPTGALGLELTTDYHGRTKVQAYCALFAMVGNFLLPWAYKLCFVFGGSQTDGVLPEIRGARVVGVLFGLFVLVTALSPAFFCRERPEAQQQEKIRILPAIMHTARNRAFLCIAGITLLAIVAVLLPLPLGQYINIYYVFGGDKEAASMLGAWGGTLNTVACVLATPLVAWCGMRFGKRRSLLAGLVVCCTASLSFWFTLTPRFPYLQLISLVAAYPAYLAAWILVPSMLADVCDLDELKTGLRREGMYGAINAWMFKAGTGLTLAFGGLLIQWSGVRPELAAAQTPEAILRMRAAYAVVPAACIALAIVLAFLCPLTEKRTREVRVLLDERHARRSDSSGGGVDRGVEIPGAANQESAPAPLLDWLPAEEEQ
jgi:GPH family glycoside/pentoside/hexuronide:cation symporter